MAPGISEAEWTVMRVVWQEAPVTARRIIEALAHTSDWKPKTIKSMLGRLVKKGVLHHEADGREYIYTPLMNEVDCVRAETRSFLDRVFGGSLTPMVARLAEDGALARDEIEQLRKLLEERREARRASRKRPGGQR